MGNPITPQTLEENGFEIGLEKSGSMTIPYKVWRKHGDTLTIDNGKWYYLDKDQYWELVSEKDIQTLL